MRDANHHRHPLAGPIVHEGRGSLPVIMSISHSGHDYPRWLLDLSRRGKGSLEPLEDPLVDRLAWRAMALGVGAVIAQAPRAAIDCNRSPAELDTSSVAVAPDGDPGLRARSGLGIVPARTAQSGELWRRKISRSEFERRMAQAYRPYHDALEQELQQLNRAHPEVLLLDCHSMPPRSPGQSRIVLGDRHGASCGRWLGDLAKSLCEEAGYPTSFNDPFAGGWIIEKHGRPALGVHALQLEIDRSLYLDARQREPGSGFDELARLLATLVEGLGTALLDRYPICQAAE